MLQQKSKHLLSLTLAAGLVFAFSHKEAAAEKRVVVLKIKGDKRSKIAKSLTRIIDNDHKIIAGSTYELQASKLNAKRLSPRNVRKVASRIEADGVLTGKIRRKGGRYVLRLRLIEGSTGKVIKKIAVKLRSRRLSRKMRRAIAERLVAAMDDLKFVENTKDAIKEEDGDSDSGSKDDDDDDDDKKDDDDSDSSDDGEKRSSSSSAGGVTKSVNPGSDTPSDALWVSAGLSVVSRKLTFTSDPGLAEAPQGYKGPMAPGVYVAGEVFPLAMDGKRSDALSNVGFGFALDKVVSINTILQDPAGGMNITLPTLQTQWGASVKYRHKLSDTATVLASVGYNRSRFTVDRSGLDMDQVLDLPNTNYTYWDPGLTLRYKTSAKMMVEVDGRALLVTGAGEVQTPEQYGSAKVTGFEAGVKISYVVKPRVVLNIGARYMAIGYDFNGDGDQTRIRDNDPDTIDVGGALDTYMRGSVSLGYLF